VLQKRKQKKEKEDKVLVLSVYFHIIFHHYDLLNQSKLLLNNLNIYLLANALSQPQINIQTITNNLK
jgi:hypothetical protein